MLSLKDPLVGENVSQRYFAIRGTCTWRVWIGGFYCLIGFECRGSSLLIAFSAFLYVADPCADVTHQRQCIIPGTWYCLIMGNVNEYLLEQ